MKILHVCLAAFYIDNFGYQENIIPKLNKMEGHEVYIVASTETYIESVLGYVKPSTYMNENDIKVTRLPYVSYLPKKVAQKVRLYKGLTSILNEFSPNLIYLHDCQFLSVIEIRKYADKNECVIISDCHTDFVNSARNWVSKYLLHGILYKSCIQYIEPKVTKFYGTLPLRNDFLVDFYGVPKSKVELLEFGFDDSEIDFSEFNLLRKQVRSKLGLNNDSILLIAGGKIDGRKNILNLLKAFRNLKLYKNIKLLIFGKAISSLEMEYLSLVDHDNIIDVGWLNSKEINEYIISSDLAIFPGTHSVIWEQVVGAGVPAIFKKWNGIEHIDLKGNCSMLETGSQKEIEKELTRILEDSEVLNNMKKAAIENRDGKFIYSKIAKRVLENI